MEVRRFLGKIAGVYLAIGALSVSASAVADVYPGHDQVGGWGQLPVSGESWGGPSCAPVSCVTPSCQQQEVCNPPPACGIAYNPPGYFNCNNCCSSNGGFFDSLRFRADFLWWRAASDCLTLGTEQFNSTFPDKSEHIVTREKSPDYTYNPGFRIGLATICPCDCWDLAVNWTHFHSKSTARGKTDFSRPGTGLSDLSQEVVFTSDWNLLRAIPDFAIGKWTLDLDLVDLEFGRKYYVSSCFVLRPHFGLRGARIDQGFRVHSEANRNNPYDEFASAFFVSNTKAKSNFLGVGPRIGVDLELALPCWSNIKLFGQAAGSVLFGRFERHAREVFHDFGGGEEERALGIPQDLLYEARATKLRTSRGVSDIAIGLKWEHCCNWCNRSHPITIAAAWEHHAFYNFNHFIFGDNHHCGGDLTTQGLTVTAEIGF